MSTVSPDRLRTLLDPVVSSLGADLEDVTVRRAGKRSSIVVVVDKDGGVDLDTVAQVARRASAALDGTDAMGEQPYVLEVTSPGTDRPLTQPRHWRRARGRLVDVVHTDGSTSTGRVSTSDGKAAELDIGTTTRSVRYVDISRATVQIEFSRAVDHTEGEDDPDEET